MRAQFFLNKSDPPSAAPQSEPPASSGKKKRGWVGKFFIFLIILALAGGLGYLGKLYYDAQKELKDFRMDVASKVNNLSQEEMDVLIRQVGKHISLPNERPQVVTITNIEQLRINQPFFNSAQNGDKLLVFTNRVILYRPTIDKVIDLAQIRPASTSGAATPSASPKEASPTATARR